MSEAFGLLSDFIALSQISTNAIKVGAVTLISLAETDIVSRAKMPFEVRLPY
jgi:hypothetical protein